jgi:beta-galactosidase
VGEAHAEVAIVFDYASHWAWQSLRRGADFDYFQAVFGLYKALRRQGLSIDCVPSTATDLSAYRLIFAPGSPPCPRL